MSLILIDSNSFFIAICHSFSLAACSYVEGSSPASMSSLTSSSSGWQRLITSSKVRNPRTGVSSYVDRFGVESDEIVVVFVP